MLSPSHTTCRPSSGSVWPVLRRFHRETGGAQQMGHCVKTLRMAGDDQPLHRDALFRRQGLPCLQPQGPLRRRGCRPAVLPDALFHRHAFASAAAGPGPVAAGRGRRGIELEVAGHHHRRDAQRLQPLRILGGFQRAPWTSGRSFAGPAAAGAATGAGFFHQPRRVRLSARPSASILRSSWGQISVSMISPRRGRNVCG